MIRILFALALAQAQGPAQAVTQTSPGVLGRFGDLQRSAQFTAAAPHFYLEPGESIHPSLDAAFRGEWSGQLKILENAAYEFSHDITIAGVSARRHTLTPGLHAFTLHYRRPATGPAQLRLQWRTPLFDWEPIPASAFSYAGAAPPDPVETGRALVRTAACANCHAAAAGLERRVPPLAAVGQRTNTNWLYAFLAQHQSVTPEQAKDLTAHLASLKGGVPVKPRRANEVAIGKGGELFGTYGCQHCHAGGFTGLGSKYTLAVLTDELQSRHQPSMMLNDDDATALAAYLTRSTDAAFEKPAPAGEAASGARFLASLGCNGCHGQARAARPLSQLMSEACPRVAPKWSAAERDAVRRFLTRPPERSPAPVYALAGELQRFQCNACHQPGTEAPPLEGVGEKLKTAWISNVLWGRARIRHGRELRMPHYDEAALRPIVASFAKVAGLAPGEGPASPGFTADERTAGNGLLGTNPKKRGMACIGCHDWGEFKSLGEEGPQLINATTRLRFDWFERWMRNPARILSGTSMPSYFGGKAAPGIHALWAGLELGAKAPVPEGYRTGDLEATHEAKPVPGKEAIVIRWDMPEATPAAIAVGLPGGDFSYCFDAGESRLLYAWRGGFLDLTGTLLRKTDSNKLTPVAALAGKVFWRSAGFPIRMGAEKRIPRRQFKGYRLLVGLPRFHYQVDGIDVFESLTVDGAGLRRELTFSRVEQAIYFEGRLVPRGTNVTMEARLTP